MYLGSLASGLDGYILDRRANDCAIPLSILISLWFYILGTLTIRYRIASVCCRSSSTVQRTLFQDPVLSEICHDPG